MMSTVCVVAFIAAVAMTAGPTASARTTLAGGDQQTPLYQSWADEAAALVPVPDLPVTVIQARCPLRDATWCVDRNPPARLWTGGNTFYLWEHPEEHDDGDRLGHRLSFLHELGHVFDLVARGPKGYRKAFARNLGLPFTRWGRRQWNLEEQFAMAYSFCAMYRHYGDAAFARTVWWGYGYEPTPDQYERVCFVIRNAGAYGRRGLLRLPR
jgi:hypothetical protein